MKRNRLRERFSRSRCFMCSTFVVAVGRSAGMRLAAAAMYPVCTLIVFDSIAYAVTSAQWRLESYLRQVPFATIGATCKLSTAQSSDFLTFIT